jgi:hypothetical protein
MNMQNQRGVPQVGVSGDWIGVGKTCMKKPNGLIIDQRRQSSANALVRTEMVLGQSFRTGKQASKADEMAISTITAGLHLTYFMPG